MNHIRIHKNNNSEFGRVEVFIGKGVRLDKLATIGSDVSLDDYCRISEFVTIERRVEIDMKTHLGQACFIGSETFIGSGCRIGMGVEIGNAGQIGNDVKIGQDTCIGNRAQIECGSKIGVNCEIGANCYLGEGVVLGHRVKLVSGVDIPYGTVIKKTPLQIITSKNHYPICAISSKLIIIGCQRRTIDNWLENYREVGDRFGFTENEILEYGSHLHYIKIMLG